MKVKCSECKHTHELAGDEVTTWLCACAAVSDKCDCDALNVIEAED